MRLGVHSDLVYRREGTTLSNNRAFIRFVTSLPPRVEEIVLFGRLDPVAGRSPYLLPTAGVRLVALPYYRRATAIWRLLRSVWSSCAMFAAELPRLDVVLVFGPQPLALAFAAIARRHGMPLVLGVRHDYPEYIRHRLPSRWWLWADPVARAMDLAFRRLARRAPTVALGEHLARRYRGGAPVINMGFSLVRRDDLRPLDEALAVSWHGERVILSVGRLDPEKNPLLLIDVIDALNDRDGRWRMVVAGEGALREEMERRVVDRGLSYAVTFVGEVPNGPRLWRLYQTSHLFLHVSLTDGLPQVLIEAQAAGIPIVATQVGGVADALGGGTAGLLVPPSDPDAAAAAVERVANDEALRRRLVTEGLRTAERHTIDVQLDRLSAFIREALDLARAQ